MVVFTVIATIGSLIVPGLTQETGTDLTPYITAVSTEKAIDGEWISATEFTLEDSIRITINYALGADIVTLDSKTVYYQIPSGIGLNDTERGSV